MTAALLDDLDRALMRATQTGLPLVSEPFKALAEQLGTTEDDILARFRRWEANGVLRRIAAVPNHYALGYVHNGMTVWDVADERVDELGIQVGALPGVSHCYRRPRELPIWRYNLFAMVHGRSRDEVERQAAQIRALLGDACRASDILYSSAILKKTGLRLTES